jgi:hypothetical protein
MDECLSAAFGTDNIVTDFSGAMVAVHFTKIG